MYNPPLPLLLFLLCVMHHLVNVIIRQLLGQSILLEFWKRHVVLNLRSNFQLRISLLISTAPLTPSMVVVMMVMVLRIIQQSTDVDLNLVIDRSS